MYNYLSLAPSQIEYVPVAEAGEVLNGERIYVQIDNMAMVVFNLAGTFFAIGDVCSHDGNSLDDAPLEGNEVVCPRHGARFDVRNGKALCLPAVEDIPAYPVRVVDGQIEVGVPLNS